MSATAVEGNCRAIPRISQINVNKSHSGSRKSAFGDVWEQGLCIRHLANRRSWVYTCAARVEGDKSYLIQVADSCRTYSMYEEDKRRYKADYHYFEFGGANSRLPQDMVWIGHLSIRSTSPDIFSSLIYPIPIPTY